MIEILQWTTLAVVRRRRAVPNPEPVRRKNRSLFYILAADRWPSC